MCPHHEWGEDFDWDDLQEAMGFIYKYCKWLAGLRVLMKEKYGTIRYEYVWLWRHSDWRLINMWQNWIFKVVVTRACKKFPHIALEIIDDLKWNDDPPYFKQLYIYYKGKINDY